MRRLAVLTATVSLDLILEVQLHCFLKFDIGCLYVVSVMPRPMYAGSSLQHQWIGWCASPRTDSVYFHLRKHFVRSVSPFRGGGGGSCPISYCFKDEESCSSRSAVSTAINLACRAILVLSTHKSAHVTCNFSDGKFWINHKTRGSLIIGAVASAVDRSSPFLSFSFSTECSESVFTLLQSTDRYLHNQVIADSLQHFALNTVIIVPAGQ